MRLMFLTTVFALSATAAVAGDWRLTSYRAEGATILDVSSVRDITPSKRVAWTAVVWPRTTDRGSEYILMRDEFDCRQETITSIALVEYGLHGTTLSQDHTRQQPVFVAPGTIRDETFRAVCQSDPTHSDQSWSSVPEFMARLRSVVR